MDKDKLLAPRLAEGEHEIEGIGVVRFRSVTRAQMLRLREGGQLSGPELEAAMLSLALIDPEMTPEEVTQWQEASPCGEMEPLLGKVVRLSGLDKGEVKEAMSQFPDGQ